jgi:hypothetical protein
MANVGWSSQLFVLALRSLPFRGLPRFLDGSPRDNEMTFDFWSAGAVKDTKRTSSGGSDKKKDAALRQK